MSLPERLKAVQAALTGTSELVTNNKLQKARAPSKHLLDPIPFNLIKRAFEAGKKCSANKNSLTLF